MIINKIKSLNFPRYFTVFQKKFTKLSVKPYTVFNKKLSCPTYEKKITFLFIKLQVQVSAKFIIEMCKNLWKFYAFFCHLLYNMFLK